jgi:hypothetical protein
MFALLGKGSLFVGSIEPAMLVRVRSYGSGLYFLFIHEKELEENGRKTEVCNRRVYSNFKVKEKIGFGHQDAEKGEEERWD